MNPRILWHPWARQGEFTGDPRSVCATTKAGQGRKGLPSRLAYRQHVASRVFVHTLQAFLSWATLTAPSRKPWSPVAKRLTAQAMVNGGIADFVPIVEPSVRLGPRQVGQTRQRRQPTDTRPLVP